MGIPDLTRTGQSGLFNSKAAMTTIGHNITHANREGYSRQRVLAQPSETVMLAHHTFGTGTKTSRVERVHNPYLQNQLNEAYQGLTCFEEKDFILKQIEVFFNELHQEGLSQCISQFFNEFRKLSQQPESLVLRNSIRESTQVMIAHFHRLRKELNQFINQIDKKIEGLVEEANQIFLDIMELNEKIKNSEQMGSVPNDLLDQRELMLKKLSSILDVTVNEDPSGNFNIYFNGRIPLIFEKYTEKLFIEKSYSESKGENCIDLYSHSHPQESLNPFIQGGKLRALFEVRDQLSHDLLGRLDDLAYQFISHVNALHIHGVNLINTDQINYFKPLLKKERAAELISLSEDVQLNSSLIASGLDFDAPGDNRLAIAISRLQSEKMMGENYFTMDEWYHSMMHDVGLAIANNEFQLNRQKDMFIQLNHLRDQISGVSIDEETTHLIQLQHIYDASAKLVQVADELIKAILNLNA